MVVKQLNVTENDAVWRSCQKLPPDAKFNTGLLVETSRRNEAGEYKCAIVLEWILKRRSDGMFVFTILLDESALS